MKIAVKIAMKEVGPINARSGRVLPSHGHAVRPE
jgi:hypothetical protein